MNPLYDNGRNKNQNNNFTRQYNNNQCAGNSGQHAKGIAQNNFRQPYGANQNNRSINQSKLANGMQN